MNKLYAVALTALSAPVAAGCTNPGTFGEAVLGLIVLLTWGDYWYIAVPVALLFVIVLVSALWSLFTGKW